MGEAAEQKIPTLAEQWSLPPPGEQSAQNVISDVSSKDEEPKYPASQVEHIEKPDETPVKEKADEAPAIGSAAEAPPSEGTNETPATEKTTNISSEDKPDDAPTVEENTESPQEEQSEEQEDAEVKPEIKIETVPADFRFPTTNQTRHCFTRYIEYHRCIQAKGEDAQECNKFAKYYRSLCPSEWIERWNEQRENGTFPGPL